MCSQHMHSDENEQFAQSSDVQEKSELNNCLSSLQTCHKERDEWKEKYLYARADFDNIQRRMAKDMDRLLWDAQAKILKDVIEIVADFERALEVHKNEQEGFILIYKRMLKMLDQAGVKEVAVGSEFDPELHEAVAHVASSDHQSGSVVQVLQKGYLFKNEILRPARVSVAQ
jgi:molecular chaperone GrpE